MTLTTTCYNVKLTEAYNYKAKSANWIFLVSPVKFSLLNICMNTVRVGNAFCDWHAFNFKEDNKCSLRLRKNNCLGFFSQRLNEVCWILNYDATFIELQALILGSVTFDESMTQCILVT